MITMIPARTRSIELAWELAATAKLEHGEIVRPTKMADNLWYVGIYKVEGMELRLKCMIGPMDEWMPKYPRRWYEFWKARGREKI